MTESAKPDPDAFRRAFDAGLAQIEPVTQALADWAEARGVPVPVMNSVALMLDELITNVVTHGYAGVPGPVRVDAVVTEGALAVTLTDHAVAFDPLQLAAPDTSLDIDEREIGGLGVFFVRRMADEIAYRRLDEGTAGAANELRFVKRFVARP